MVYIEILIITGSVVTPLFMFVSRKFWPKSKTYMNILAIISALIFGNIASLAIHDIIEDNTVFMTNIHGLFLNSLFLWTGAYLGVYLLYRLTVWALDELNEAQN